MRRIYYDLLSQKLKDLYAEIEEDLIFSGLSLRDCYEKYRDTYGEEDCRKVIAAMAGDKGFLAMADMNSEKISDLIFFNAVSFYRESLQVDLRMFSNFIDYLVYQKGSIEKDDDFMIANCLCHYMQLKNVPCAIALAEKDGKKVFCNLICDEEQFVKVQITADDEFMFPYREQIDEEFIEAMMKKVVKGNG